MECKEARKLMEKAPIITGKTISAYMLNNAQVSTQKDIELMESITLKNKDKEMCCSLLTTPPATKDSLKKLFNSDQNNF